MATLLGQFVEAAYAMFQANPGDPTPAELNFPTGYKLIAEIEMRDFIIGSNSTLLRFHRSEYDRGQSVRRVPRHGRWRGMVGRLQLHRPTPSRVPGCGSVGAGFAGSTTRSHLSRTLPPPPQNIARRKLVVFARLAVAAGGGPRFPPVGLSSESVACGVEVVLALLRAEEIADFTDGAPEGVDGPDGAGSQKGLQLCESHLDRIEVGAIGRKE